MSAEGFHGLWLSFCEEHPNYKFLLASTKSLTNCENPSSNNPLQKACSGFPIAACDSKSCSVSRLWSWKLFRKPAMNECWRKLTNEREGKQNSDAAVGTVFRINKCFQKIKQILCIYFSGTRKAKKCKHNLRMDRMLLLFILIQFYRPSKKYPTGDRIPFREKELYI